MFLIQTNTQLQQLKNSNPNIRMIIPIWSSHIRHEWISNISFVYLRINADTHAIINLNHIDANKCEPFDISELANPSTLVFNNRYIRANAIDYEWAYFEEYGVPFNLINFVESLYKGHDRQYTELNDCIPLTKWMEKLQTLPMPEKNADWYKPYSDAITVLGQIEEAGVKVDTDIFNVPNTLDGMAYTKYNPYTTTGRPSNRHSGINWSALNKSDGTRKGIISRWKGGQLIQFDYESYHIRLIAGLVGYKLPTGITAHQHLADHYGTDYETAKRLTFKYLYGGFDADALLIPFFKSVDDWMERLWNGFIINGYIETPIYKRKIGFKRIEEPSKQKVFNYLLQAFETEVNYKKLKPIMDSINSNKSKVILYTYDAILIDLHPDESYIIEPIRNIMEHGGLPVRMYAGNNYDSLTFIQ